MIYNNTTRFNVVKTTENSNENRRLGEEARRETFRRLAEELAESAARLLHNYSVADKMRPIIVPLELLEA